MDHAESTDHEPTQSQFRVLDRIQVASDTRTVRMLRILSLQIGKKSPAQTRRRQTALTRVLFVLLCDAEER